MELEVLLAFYKALADRSRLEIVGLISRQPASVGEIAEILDLSEPTVSHHLARLREAGLAVVEPDGTTRRYRLDAKRLDDLSRALLADEPVGEAPARADAREAAVLKAFVSGETLLEIPAKRSKRDVILRWLIQRFTPGERISEREVNERIARSHEDTAWLRRELVVAGLLNREQGIYWRPE